jgi:hypothetical protein
VVEKVEVISNKVIKVDRISIKKIKVKIVLDEKINNIQNKKLKHVII